MSDTISRLAGPVALGNAAATVIGPVPGGQVWTILDLQVCNEAAAAHTLTLSVGTDGAGKRLYKGLSIPANNSFLRTGKITLTSAEFIQAYADAAGNLTLTATGVVTT